MAQEVEEKRDGDVARGGFVKVREGTRKRKMSD